MTNPNDKFAQHVRPAQRIRSYDFEPIADRGESYLEGVVTEIDDRWIHFVVDRVVIEGDDDPFSITLGREARAPLQVWPRDWADRLMIVSE